MSDALLHSKDILDAMMNGMVVPHKRDEELLRYYAVMLDEALKREGRRCPVNAASCNLRRLFERYPYMCSEQKPKNGAVMVEALKFAIARAEEAMGYVFRSSGPKACMEELINECREALCAPPRNCDKPEFADPEKALNALAERFPLCEELYSGFKVAVHWLLDTQDYCLANPVSRRFGQAPEKGGAE